MDFCKVLLFKWSFRIKISENLGISWIFKVTITIKSDFCPLIFAWTKVISEFYFIPPGDFWIFNKVHWPNTKFPRKFVNFNSLNKFHFSHVHPKMTLLFDQFTLISPCRLSSRFLQEQLMNGIDGKCKEAKQCVESKPMWWIRKSPFEPKITKTLGKYFLKFSRKTVDFYQV